MIKFRNLLEETKIGNKTFDDMELCPGAVKAFKKDYETKDNKDEVLAAAQAVDDYLAIERKGLNGKVDESDLEKMKGMVDVAKKKIADAGLSADDHNYHQGHIDKVTALVKKSNMEEKTLTPAEIKKRDEIAKAIKKDDPDMPMDKKMAIATATAKRVAEKKTVRQLLDPKKEVMVVKMMGKRHKVIVIDKSKEKEYLSKGWMLAEETQLNVESVELEESDTAKLYRLYTKAMKMMPGSPAQKKVSAEIDKLRKKLGMDESLNETVSAALHIKGMRTATAHAKKDGANIKDKNVFNKYFIYHMKKNNRMTHFKKDANGNLDFNSIGDGTKIEPKHYKDIFNKTKKESLEEAVSPAQQAAIAISKKERGEKPKNEASAAADARRAMKSRGATKGMALTKKDRDTEATDDDRKAASKNIIMQLRKAADLPTGAEVVFNRGKGKVSRDQAKAALARFDALSKPNEKEKFQKSIRSLADIKKILGR